MFVHDFLNYRLFLMSDNVKTSSIRRNIVLTSKTQLTEVLTQWILGSLASYSLVTGRCWTAVSAFFHLIAVSASCLLGTLHCSLGVMVRCCSNKLHSLGVKGKWHIFQVLNVHLFHSLQLQIFSTQSSSISKIFSVICYGNVLII